MVVTSITLDPPGDPRSPEDNRGGPSPEIPKNNNNSKAKFEFDPSETVIVVRRKDPSKGENKSLLLKSLLKQQKSQVKGGRIEKIRFMKR